EERYYRDRETQAEEGKTNLAPIIVNPSMRVERFGINSTQGLHSVATHLHFFECGLSFQCACISWLLEQHKSLIALRQYIVQAQGKPTWSLLDGASAEKSRLSLDLSLEFANNRHKQVLELVYRITTQVKIVDNMVTQDDSHTNIAIAEQSRKIAIETKRDSVAMKAIAALTMAFLPGTFVGTIDEKGRLMSKQSIFSMAFFGAGDQGLDVNSSWWLYVAVTLPLTALVIGLWPGWLRWKAHTTDPLLLEPMRMRTWPQPKNNN
ncbi:MAG: hypothetical protein Q9214_006536, partial [Letrouitia sp. 1 TL-2023]